MDVGNLPDNRKKNRYRNNRPCKLLKKMFMLRVNNRNDEVCGDLFLSKFDLTDDDTRVKLSVKNGVPTSDYINANHITVNDC